MGAEGAAENHDSLQFILQEPRASAEVAQTWLGSAAQSSTATSASTCSHPELTREIFQKIQLLIQATLETEASSAKARWEIFFLQFPGNPQQTSVGYDAGKGGLWNAAGNLTDWPQQQQASCAQHHLDVHDAGGEGAGCAAMHLCRA